MPYRNELRVAFDDADPGGVLFFGRFLSHAHRGIEEYISDLGIEWADWYAHAEWAVPIRHVEADYRRPLWAGHTYGYEVTLTEMRRSSVVFRTRFLEGKHTCAVVTSTHVFIDKQSLKARPIPGDIAAKLKPHCGS